MANAKRDKTTEEYRLRHSLAHVLAQAVLEIRPNAKLGFGPPVDNGFYYDFDFQGEPLAEAVLPDLETRMRRIIRERQSFVRTEMSVDVAVQQLEAAGQSYKVEYAKDLISSGKAAVGNLSFYQNGPFVDMCEGPHVDHTGKLPEKGFKLDTISGSYWRGDETRPMLTRINGLAFETSTELEEYLQRRELARERDHRKLGAELDLFVFDDEIGTGLPLWLPNGAIIRDELERWAREEEFKEGYQRVSTPVLTRGELYYRSGHLPYYAGSMYPPMQIDDQEQYFLRPMNCPHHHKVYAARPRSYRDLPLRLAEFGDVYRYEQHGSLSGMLRVRAMCQNDAHIYCEPSQVKEEFKKVIALYRRYYNHLRLGGFRIRLSLHAPGDSKFVDDEEGWSRTEQIVREVLSEENVPFEEEVGEAAFYGPKMDVQLKNLMGREETVSTCQLDFLMARRFGLTYTSRENTPESPYIIHRAPLGTHERTISFLLEMYGGAFPTWMAPVQVCLLPIGPDCVNYAREIQHQLVSRMHRVAIDESSETFNKRVRTAVTRKVPNIWVIGNEEIAARTVAWRRYCTREQSKVPVDRAVAVLAYLVRTRAMDNFADQTLEIPEPLHESAPPVEPVV
jgi:threonyl-tRNA synthetase